ncbi:hypothetical protein B0H11DRAFT_1723751 [Mycena galericulata]|nr:hypothetical protein B0H11DRAFT_1723751 [Mycena galericulata]
MEPHPRRASFSIKFIVVGGSVSGLSCGYVLRKAGHEVILLVGTGNARSESGSFGSIKSPPNMTRLLNGWPGMATSLGKHATRCSGYDFYITGCSDTSETLGFMKFHEEIMSELQADFVILQVIHLVFLVLDSSKDQINKHDDLRRHLTSLCSAVGVVIEYGCKAVDVKLADGGSVNVVLEDGKILHGDIVIGADGHNSFVRGLVVEGDLQATHTVTGYYEPRANISISTKDMKENPDLKSLYHPNEVHFYLFSLTIWMGNGSSVVGTVDSTGEKLNLSICFPTHQETAEGDWYGNHPLAEKLPFELSEYDPRLFQLGYTCCSTVHQVFEQDDIIGLDGTVVLVGDAAHSALIHGSHNSSMAIEDTVTLGRLFSHLSNRRQIPLLLHAYQEIRYPRTTATQDSEYQSLVQISLPRGALQEGRDAALKETLSKAFEDFQNCGKSEMIQQTWAEYLVLFSHDANEEVDNWWTMWGSVVDGLA